MKKKLSFLCLALVLPFLLAQGAVTLVFTPTSVTDVQQGGFFDVSLRIDTTASEQISGLDYFFQELSAAGFFILARTGTDASPFDDTNFTDDEVASSNDQDIGAGTNGEPDNLLNPRNDVQLGATTDSGNAAPAAASYFVGNYRIGVGASVPAGTYTISTAPQAAGLGWVDGMDGNHEFDQQASVTITVIPEPTTWSLIALAGVGAFGVNLLRRRRS